MTVGVDINDAFFGGSSVNRELVIAPTSDKNATDHGDGIQKGEYTRLIFLVL